VEAVTHAAKHATVTRADVESLMRRSVCVVFGKDFIEVDFV